MKRFGQIGNVHVGEIDVSGTRDENVKAKAINIVLDSCLKSGSCKSILFFTPFDFNSQFDSNPQLFHPDYTPGVPYFVVGKTLKEFLSMR
jgi:hypothetical protein